MSGGLVRGGSGEISLRQILQTQFPHLASAMRRDTEAIARKYEADHPGVVVVCDWEIIDDEDLAALTGAAKQQALRDRGALAARREAAQAYQAPPIATRAGDPTRTAEVLRRARNDMRLLDVTHPEYLRLFYDLAKQINGYEAALIAAGVEGVKITEFTPTMRFAKPEGISAAKRKELETKVEAYKALTATNRKLSIERATDPDLTRMLLEVEEDQAIREAITIKLFTMGAVATV